jgi:hypothetical protein
MSERDVLAPSALIRIAGIAAVFVAVIASLVALTAAAQARHLLGFGFAGVPPRIGQAAAILLNNGRFVLGAMVAASVSQLRLRRTLAGDRTESIRALTGMSRVVDLTVALFTLANALLVGVAVGAYGWRMVVGLLPHGPFEVLGYCVAANLFLNARRRPIHRREWVIAGIACLSLLTVAAVLETFVWLG